MNPEPSTHRLFATTRWSVVRAAGDAVSPTVEQAREQLCRLYWPALYAWLRREGHPPNDAEDLVQGFLAQFINRNDFATAQSDRGRFRSYLLTALRHYVVSARRREDAVKRGGGVGHVSWDELHTEEMTTAVAAPDLTAEQAFDRRWLASLLAAALERLENDYAAAGQAERFAILKPWLAADPPDGAYEPMAEKLGVARATIATWVSRLRMRFRELVHEQIRDTVSSPEEFEQELRDLLRVL